jgi:hypothetical protein
MKKGEESICDLLCKFPKKRFKCRLVFGGIILLALVILLWTGLLTLTEFFIVLFLVVAVKMIFIGIFLDKIFK